MKKLKNWLLCRVLPIWAREALLERIRQLEQENARLREEGNRQRAYIAGLETGMKGQRKVVIVNGGGKPSSGGGGFERGEPQASL